MSRDWLQTFSQQAFSHTTQINPFLAPWSWYWLKDRPICSSLPQGDGGEGLALQVLYLVLFQAGEASFSAQHGRLLLVTSGIENMQIPMARGAPMVIPAAAALMEEGSFEPGLTR